VGGEDPLRAWLRRFAPRARRIVRRGALGLAGALALLILAIYLVPMPAIERERSVTVELADGTVAHAFLTADEKWRLPVDLARVDPALVAALVALEDKRFGVHPGVDPLAIVRAAWSNLTSGRRVSGGSTLPMQLARMYEPRPRTLRSKLVEVFRALQIGVRMEREAILGEYLSRAAYGRNLEGVESAAMAYFGHSAAHLTAVEIATLLAVPQGPARFAPSAANAARLRARRDRILGKLVAADVFRAADVVGQDAPPPDRLRPMPRLAPHASIWLRREHPGLATIRTTLDAGVQVVAERTLRGAAPALARAGIHGGAIVVVDHARREIVALVGSPDFADAEHGGQIAMFARPRSPGSTLKPFLYALAIDRGLALPGFLVADVPMSYGAYRPRNFDQTWSGLVTLREALARSLNQPFVELLDRLGVEAFVGELVRMGARSPTTAPGHYGLSLIAGGIELTPLELAAMYATLAEDGRYRPLRALRDDAAASAATTAILTPSSSWLTREALSLRDRPDFPSRRLVRGLPADIHWKTGTSFGSRDAWAIGSGPRYTAVVWLGNVDQRASTELVGADAAGPILFDILEGIADRSRQASAVPKAPPAELAAVEVCAYSGHLPTAACRHRAEVLAPIHAVPPEPCPYHVELEVDTRSGRAVTPMCRAPGGHTETRPFLVLPSGVVRWLEEQHRQVPEVPRFADGCAPGLGDKPSIVTPAEGQVIVLIPGVPADHQQVPLQAETRSSSLSWFVDGALISTAPASQRVFWSPVPGTHDVVAEDESGQKHRRRIEVRAARGG
jgi:penicillin-binding protein 1C